MQGSDKLIKKGNKNGVVDNSTPSIFSCDYSKKNNSYVYVCSIKHINSLCGDLNG